MLQSVEKAALLYLFLSFSVGEAREKSTVPTRGLSEDLNGQVCRVVYSKDGVSDCL